MNPDILKYLILGLLGVGIIMGAVYYALYKQLHKKNSMYVSSLVEGTKVDTFSLEIFYQKFYVFCTRIPFIKRYTLKLRRRLEIINIEDEYLTRKQVSQIMLKSICVIIPITFVVYMVMKNNLTIMLALFLFEIMFVETIIEGFVDKIDNKLLRQQIDLFAEIRHAYHEFNMVEEAIYDVAQNDEVEVCRQADKIYEVLISDDPETELEKYYDIAPNSFLKEFAGISYLTREFGDRKDKDGASLYLKNLNNITQEMQIEIMKRDKLDYVFQSLSIIAAIPILFLDIIKKWAVSQFSFTSQFYNGTLGFYAQILMLVVTFVCYMFVRKLKDNGNVKEAQNLKNPWQEKLYSHKPVKRFVDLFIPKDGTKEYIKITGLLKDSASKLKLHWFYVNRLVFAAVACIVGIFIFWRAHAMTVKYIRTEPTSDYNLLGSMTEKQLADAMATTELHNKVLDHFENDPDATEADIKEYMTDEYSPVYDDFSGLTDKEIDKAAATIFEKLETLRKAIFKWYELLLSFCLCYVGYNGPVWVLKFQLKMRQMEMENEVMQYHTIILMLMKIERVNVEMILEWLERYSNIFREPISTCVNNFESGPWEALEELKNSLSFQELIRIVESLQAAVEKIPIREAFDELDTERNYYQEKRKESNDRMISQKSLIGKVIGFAPMVVMFVGYLIVPLVWIGMTSMSSAFTTMSGMM